MDFKHYHLVPRDIDANLRWRQKVLTDAAADPVYASALKAMCAEDCLFYINGFAWLLEPRATQSPRVPFVTYEYQDEAIAGLLEAVEDGHDVAWPKSRTMGATWMGLTALEWMWHFQHDLSFLLISRKEEYVDSRGDPKSLFSKLDFLHANQPRWLLPSGRWLGDKDPGRRSMHLSNADTGSTIDGESTTGEAGRGDRRTAMFIDEFAAFDPGEGHRALRATRDTTKCRIFNSTPQGAANAFYEVVHNTAATVVRMHWSSHPVYSQGLYSSEKDNSGTWRLKLLTDFQGAVFTQRKEWRKPRMVAYPEAYPFVLDGKMRSPWYDAECARCATEQEVAQELDIDFLGSDYQFFDPPFILMLIAECATPASMTGRLVYDRITLEPEGFELDPKGPLQLWFNLAGQGTIKDRDFFAGKQFGMGSDVSHGTGASNSATAVVDLGTGKKVALWKDPYTPPERFVEETIALAKWFNQAFMVWDASGPPGKTFTSKVVEWKYPKIYYRRSEVRTRERISDQPGYYLNPEDRVVLLTNYREKLRTRAYINQSKEGLAECLQFVVKPGGGIEHSASIHSQDPRGAREAHGDEVIADALASRILSLRGVEARVAEKEVPYMSMAWRLREQDRALAAASREDW